MSAPLEERLLRIPMSWDDYLALPEKPKAEWVKGVAVIMNVPPGFRHGMAAADLAHVLRACLPDHFVAVESYLQLPDGRVRLPDVMLTESVPAEDYVTDPPLMVAEVLSRSTREEDMVRKSVEYAEAGIGQYWLVDRELKTLTAMTNVDGTWQDAMQLDEQHPQGSIELAGQTLHVDLWQILRA